MNTLRTMTTLTLPSHFIGSISALAWSPDGARIAAASSHGSVAVWEVRTGQCVFDQQVMRDRLTALAWTGQGRCLLLGSVRGALSLLHLTSGVAMSSSTFAHSISRIAYAPNDRVERFFVVAGPTVRIFTAGRPDPITRQYATPLLDVAWCPAGRSIALLTQHGLVEIWDVAARSARFQAILRNTPRCLSWGLTDQVLTIGTEHGDIQDYSLRGDSWETAYPISRFPLAALFRGKHGVIAQSERDTVFWTDQTRQTLTDGVHALALDPRGATLATACARAITLAVLCS